MKIGILGVGRFGKEHLMEWLALQTQGLVTIVGLIVRNETSREKLAQEYNLPVYTELTADFLNSIDAIDIVTPASTHLNYIKKCLPYCHVLVEKPVVTTFAELQDLQELIANSENKIMVGHNYRFNPTITKLRELISSQREQPELVEITMLNKGDIPSGAVSANLEYLHAFDLMEYLFGLDVTIEMSRNLGNKNEINLRYGDSLYCHMNLGWDAREAKRSLKLIYGDRSFTCDLLRNSISIHHDNNFDCINFPHEKITIRKQLHAYLGYLQGLSENPVPMSEVARATQLAIQTIPNKINKRPRVAVIGGGIFGANCALALDDFCDVTLYERHPDYMEEVSFVNQWRHHSGFHYPRSYDTINEIKACKNEFESLYGDAVRRDIISYFCPSATGVEIPAERYTAACAASNLVFNFEYPPEGILDPKTVSVSIKTDEGVYDFNLLRDMVRQKLAVAKNIDAQLGTEVVDASLLKDGTKRLIVEKEGQQSTHEFDYLINATYANRNLLSKWFSFPVEPLRFDLYEMLVVKIPIPQVCVTIIDGPFTSIVGMGKDNLFLLSHIHDSVSKSSVTEDGLPPKWSNIESNRHNMLLSASKYLPILKQAEVIESRYATRAVNAFARDFDARPTVIRNQGFGCWSVLGGKIITSVSNAREIARAIRKAHD